MLIPWMLYALALSAVVTGGALAADKVAEIWAVRRRTVWIAAVAAAAVVPALVPFAPARVAAPALSPAPTSDVVERASFRVAARSTTPSMMKRLRARAVRITTSPSMNHDAARLWLLMSLALCAAFAIGAIGLRRRRARWTPARLDGDDVLLSDDVGPAVVGLARPRIVLPSWVLTMHAVERRLMLRHEREHVRARDPLVLAAAALVVTILPWNPFVWLLVRRLRLALEIDCDRRVLAGDVAAEDYGTLLLTVGARSSVALRFTASLAEPHSFLERRIVAMTTNRPARPLAASLPFIAIAAMAAVAAAQTPVPAKAPANPAPTVAAPSAPVSSSMPRPATAPMTVPMSSAPAPASAPASAPAHAPVAGAPATAPGGVAPVARPMSPPAEIPIAVLREWIQQHHPNVITGDPSVNEVVIVVDANERYLRSYARFDSVPDGARGDGPRGRGNAYVADTVQIRALGSALHRGNPLIIVDGVIVNGVDGIERERIQSVEVLKGAAAVAQYGPAAERGVIVIDTKSESLLSSMDLKADDIRQIDVVKAPPGTIGPNALRVLVVQVKN